jgi:ferredoxin
VDESADTRLYVAVDARKCCGYTTCASTAPEIFQLDDGGFAYVTDDRVPLGLEAEAMAGANSCPERAIYVGPTPPTA